MSDVRKPEEHPGVYEEDEKDLEDELDEDLLSKIDGPVDDDKDELDEEHAEKGCRNLEAKWIVVITAMLGSYTTPHRTIIYLLCT